MTPQMERPPLPLRALHVTGNALPMRVAKPFANDKRRSPNRCSAQVKQQRPPPQGSMRRARRFTKQEGRVNLGVLLQFLARPQGPFAAAAAGPPRGRPGSLWVHSRGALRAQIDQVFETVCQRAGVRAAPHRGINGVPAQKQQRDPNSKT